MSKVYDIAFKIAGKLSGDFASTFKKGQETVARMGDSLAMLNAKAAKMDPKLSHTTIWFWYLNTPYWQRCILPSVNSVCQLPLMFLKIWKCLFNGHPINTRRSTSFL